MKKTKIIILLFMSFIFVSLLMVKMPIIKASNTEEIEKLLVVKRNSNINDYLKYDDYIVISNNVNTNQVGKYVVTYKNINTNQTKDKVVIVIDEDNYAYLDEIKKIEGDYDIKIVDHVNAEGMYTYLYHFKYPNYSGENYMLYENEYATQLIVRSFRGEIFGYQYINNHYLGWGYEKSVVDNDIDMFLFSLGEEGKELIEIESQGTDIAYSVAESENFYFLAGYTLGSDELFLGDRKGKDSACVLIDKKTNEVVNTFTLGLNGDDYFKNVFYLNNYLYFLQIENEKNMRLIKTDIFGNKEQELIIYEKYGYINPEIRVINNKLYLSFSTYDYDVLDYVDLIKEVNLNLELNDVFKKYIKGYNILDYELNGDHLELLLKPKQGRGFKYQEYLNNNLIIDYYNDDAKDVIALDRDRIYMENREENFIYQINTLYIQNKPINIFDPKVNKKEELNNFDLYLNGEKSKATKLIDEFINIDIFGKYDVDYYFKSTTFDYLETIKIDVLPFVGVIDGAVYDVGLTINGNSKETRINNELVNLPYTIKDVGEYIIEIKGNDDATIRYQIRVTDLANKYKEKEEQIKIELNDYVSESNNISSSLNKRETMEKKNKNYYYMYIIPLISLIIGIVITRRGAK